MPGTRPSRGLLAILCLSATLVVGDDCAVDRDALRERLAREAAEESTGADISISADACATLPAAMPVGLSLIPGVSTPILVANAEPAAVIPMSLATEPPSVATTSAPTIPDDSDGDGTADEPKPLLAGVKGINTLLALAPANTKEQVLFVNPLTGELVTGSVAGETRSAVATAIEVTPETDAVDSAGNAAEVFTTSITSGADVAGPAANVKLVVTTSNIAEGAGSADPRFSPGTVLVYDVVFTAGVPAIGTDPPLVIFTRGFNPTNVVAYTSAGGRTFALVTTTGAAGLINEEGRIGFATGATTAARSGFVEVIEFFATDDPQLVAVIPLGEAAPGFKPLAISPNGRLGATGSLVERRMLVVDLRALDNLATTPPSEPVVLDGTDGNDNAVVTSSSLSIPAIAGAPPASVCAGTVSGAAWNAAGRLLGLEFCDGTLSSWKVVFGAAAPIPAADDAFTLTAVVQAVAPLGLNATQLQAPLDLVVRSGVFTGPDVFLLVGLPEGSLCGIASPF